MSLLQKVQVCANALQAAYFEQKFYATFLLDPVEAASAAAKPQGKQPSATKSPRHSPRGGTPQRHTVPSQPHSDPHSIHESDAAHTHSAEPSNTSQQKQGSPSSTPDLSPRTMAEADDPPTPRMYRAMVPMPARPERTSGAMQPESSQLVLHEGHFGHDSRQLSPKRSSQHRQIAHERELQELHSVIRYSSCIPSACLPVCVQLRSLDILQYIRCPFSYTLTGRCVFVKQERLHRAYLLDK